MPHNNDGEIYRTSSGGTVKSVTDTYVDGDIGVDEADVGIVLGNSSRDTGTLCKASNINKWSKRKPVSYPNVIFKLTDAQLKEINYGLSVPSQVNLLPLQTLYSNLNGANGESLLDAAYSYTKPTGETLASPFRLLDFEKYYHGAMAPISVTSEDGNFNIKVNTQLTVYQFSFLMNISGSESVIGLRDLSTNFDNYYLSLGVLKDGVWYVKTAIRPVTNSLGGYITLNSTDLNDVIEQEVPRTCVVALCRRGDNQWSDYLTQGRAASVLFYYPPMRSAAGCIGTIKYTAAGGFSVSLHPSVSTISRGGEVEFGMAIMQIRLGHAAGSQHTGDVTFSLTLTSSKSESLEDKITTNHTISFGRDKKSCTVIGTISGPFEIGSSGYIDIGSLFKTLTQDLVTSGTVGTDYGTFSVYDGGGWVVDQQQ